MAFSTNCTCSLTSVSEVGPNSPTLTPKSPPAFCAPASIVCQNDESLALMMTSTRLPAAAPPSPPPPLLPVPPVARPATTPTTAAMRAITATREAENTTLPRNRFTMAPF
jgi:hypothetical protein